MCARKPLRVCIEPFVDPVWQERGNQLFPMMHHYSVLNYAELAKSSAPTFITYLSLGQLNALYVREY